MSQYNQMRGKSRRSGRRKKRLRSAGEILGIHATEEVKTSGDFDLNLASSAGMAGAT